MTGTPDLLAIVGLQPGSLPMWLMLSGFATWWIKGIADRRRSANEGMTVESVANDKLFMNLTAEVERMGKKLSAAEGRILHLEIEIRDVREAKSKTDAENVVLRAQLGMAADVGVAR